QLANLAADAGDRDVRLAVLGRLRPMEQGREPRRVDEGAAGEVEHDGPVAIARGGAQQLSHARAGGDVELAVDLDDPDACDDFLRGFEPRAQDHSRIEGYWASGPPRDCARPSHAVPACPFVSQPR